MRHVRHQTLKLYFNQALKTPRNDNKVLLKAKTKRHKRLTFQGVSKQISEEQERPSNPLIDELKR
ncbi:hypothetical protein MED121_18840 [Marinomonas sp. MED121]|nr:hypothetical protein MED121_18840 [Marinomonas sp. MED121]